MKKYSQHSKQLEECIAELYSNSLSDSELIEAKNNLSGFLETLFDICDENNIQLENTNSEVTYNQ